MPATIYLEEGVVNAVRQYGAGTGHEVGGILVGLNAHFTKDFESLYVLAAVQKTDGSAGGVAPLHKADAGALGMLADAGLTPQMTTVGWWHTHPWQGGHKGPSSTDFNTQLRYQIANPQSVAIISSTTGLAVYRVGIVAGAPGSEGLDMMERPYQKCSRITEFPKLEYLLKDMGFLLREKKGGQNVRQKA